MTTHRGISTSYHVNPVGGFDVPGITIAASLGEYLRSPSKKVHAVSPHEQGLLSRPTADIRNKTLIANLPGKPKAIPERLDGREPAVAYCIDLLGGPHPGRTTTGLRPSVPVPINC